MLGLKAALPLRAAPVARLAAPKAAPALPRLGLASLAGQQLPKVRAMAGSSLGGRMQLIVGRWGARGPIGFGSRRFGGVVYRRRRFGRWDEASATVHPWPAAR